MEVNSQSLMEVTFKPDKRQRSIPFLIKFRQKISRVDRVSGLLGALGVSSRIKDVSEIKKRCKTEANEIKIRSDPRHQKDRLNYESIKVDHENVSVHDFPTIVSEDGSNKQNFRRNGSEQQLDRVYKFRKRKDYLDECGELRPQKDLNDLILPKINLKAGMKESQQKSRVKSRLVQRKNQKKMVMVLANEQKRNLLLR